ncbi:DUF4404 family protein [Oxalobacter sp. OxGP1]|uniref:DUF4404 family protein n=1 Tax=Oxalobacter paeniformigenes TaxID=2946594 RepID=UPI0022AE980E|nr:DUF4404 family protein [Oxalobacter paeniformigenes]MCZ4053028.1 DUF4404 family protein [Oxalobacter paeniformigenes]
MDEIGNVLDRIHEHMAKADRIDPQYRQAFQELDKNIRAMKRAQNDNAATELASLDRQARFLAARFETEHPQIGALIQRLSVLLQGMGM